MNDRPLARLHETEKALETGQQVPVTKHGGRSAWERLRWKVAQEGIGDVILEAIARVIFVPPCGWSRSNAGWPSNACDRG
jgi:hypothetical protein